MPNKPIVFLTRVLPKPVMERLQSAFDLRFDPSDVPHDKAQILEGVKRADGLIAMLSDPIGREVLDTGVHLKIVANYAVGYNNIDLEAAKAHRVAVTNTPGVLTETTADLTWALLMTVARRILEADQWVKAGRWTGWAPTEFMGMDVFGKTLGLVGLGRIGQAVARRAAGFNMNVVYFSRRRLPEAVERELGVSYLPLTEVLKSSDYVSFHLPLNEASHHLIGESELRRMKPSAFLINTSRGPIVDEKALCAVLAEHRIAGAGLDVYEAEPVVSPQLLQLSNVVTLPHIGSASFETRVQMGLMVMENLSAVFQGRTPPNVVES
ncbi:MAG: 2-hydroxyacid dehydrogenase [Nitrospiria bacterium]